MSNIFVAQQMAYHKHLDAFNRTFGKPLRGYYEPYIGFDITSFDSLIQTRDGQSTREALLEQHGQFAVDMILDMISGIEADGTRRNNRTKGD